MCAQKSLYAKTAKCSHTFVSVASAVFISLMVEGNWIFMNMFH